MTIEPGTPLKVIISMDSAEKPIHTVDSMLHQVMGKTMIIGQTDPPLPASILNREVTVTFLSTEKNKTDRYGFCAVIREFLHRYPISGGRIEAISVVQRTEPVIHSFRMSYRVRPTSRSGLRMTMEGHEVNVIDISLGGARVSHSAPLTFVAGTVARVTLDIDGKTYSLEAKIIAADAHTGTARDLSFASTQFVNVGETLEDALSKKIRNIERETELWVKK